MGPLIPYVEVPELPLRFLTQIPLLDRLFDPHHPPSIKPFGTLVALGVYIGSVVAMRHGKERGIPEQKLSEFIFWVVGIGFVGGHMLDAVFYHPTHLMKDPLYLFMLWDGLSSYGGFIGAVIGALAWRTSRKQKILPMCEVINSAFPLAWVFGRMGCSSVHDHPGHLSDAWFALRWPAGNGFVGRLDLGFMEMVLTIPLAVAFLYLWHRKPVRPLGFYTGWMCVAYAPVRFVLDFFREDEADSRLSGDPRYGGLTPAQWACFGLLALGVYFLLKAYRSKGDDGGGDELEAGADGDEEEEEEQEEASPDEAESAPKRAPKRVHDGVASDPKPRAPAERVHDGAESAPEAQAPAREHERTRRPDGPRARPDGGWGAAALERPEFEAEPS